MPHVDSIGSKNMKEDMRDRDHHEPGVGSHIDRGQMGLKPKMK